MSCFQNKAALAKINEDLIVQSNGHISVSPSWTLGDINSTGHSLPESLLHDPWISLHCDFLLACLEHSFSDSSRLFFGTP